MYESSLAEPIGSTQQIPTSVVSKLWFPISRFKISILPNRETGKCRNARLEETTVRTLSVAQPRSTHGISLADEPQGVALLAYIGKLLAVSGEAMRDSVCG